MEVRDAGAANYDVALKTARADDNTPPGYKRTEAGVIPEGWRICAVGAIADVKTGPFGTALHERDYVDVGTPIITVEHLGEYAVLHEDIPQVSEVDSARLKAYTLRKGDVVFSRVGSVDRNALIKDPEDGWLFSGRLLRVRPLRTVIYSPYLSYHFHSEGFKQRVRDVAVGQTMASINTQILASVNAVIPPTVAEQQAIAEALSDADALIESLQQLIAKQRALKQSAMQTLLTGRQRLPGFTGEWQTKQLGDLATFHKGKGLPKSALDDNGKFPCVHYGELFTRLPETIRETCSRTNWTGDTFRSFINDVLMPTSDVTPSGLAKASCVLMDGVIIGGDVLVIRTEAAIVYGTFLSYVIRNSESKILQLVTGTTVFHLYASDMRKFEFHIPPIAEQEAIITVLSDTDAEIDALEARLAKTRALKAGMMQQLLTGRIRLPLDRAA